MQVTQGREAGHPCRLRLARKRKGGPGGRTAWLTRILRDQKLTCALTCKMRPDTADPTNAP
jgi:hypothetical protein